VGPDCAYYLYRFVNSDNNKEKKDALGKIEKKNKLKKKKKQSNK
jgi:hypothetical protein